MGKDGWVDRWRGCFMFEFLSFFFSSLFFSLHSFIWLFGTSNGHYCLCRICRLAGFDEDRYISRHRHSLDRLDSHPTFTHFFKARERDLYYRLSFRLRFRLLHTFTPLHVSWTRNPRIRIPLQDHTSTSNGASIRSDLNCFTCRHSLSIASPIVEHQYRLHTHPSAALASLCHLPIPLPRTAGGPSVLKSHPNKSTKPER